MLDAYDPQDSPSHPHHRLTVAAKGLMAEISRRTSKSVSPYLFLNVLREAFPTFAQQGQGGVYSQQDAEECWTQLLYALKTRLGAGMEDVFSIGTRTELTCTGAEDEKVRNARRRQSAASPRAHIDQPPPAHPHARRSSTRRPTTSSSATSRRRSTTSTRASRLP